MALDDDDEPGNELEDYGEELSSDYKEEAEEGVEEEGEEGGDEVSFEVEETILTPQVHDVADEAPAPATRRGATKKKAVKKATPPAKKVVKKAPPPAKKVAKKPAKKAVKKASKPPAKSKKATKSKKGRR
jgi:hypothetical protein